MRRGGGEGEEGEADRMDGGWGAGARGCEAGAGGAMTARRAVAGDGEGEERRGERGA